MKITRKNAWVVLGLLFVAVPVYGLTATFCLAQRFWLTAGFNIIEALVTLVIFSIFAFRLIQIEEEK